jgi:hypothetical protein
MRGVTSSKPATVAAAPEGGLGEVLRAAQVLWPPPLEVAYARGGRHPSSVSEQILIPGPAARICLPGDSRRGAARTVLRFSSSLRPREFATRLLSAAAVGVGPRALVPHRLVVTGSGGDGLREHLATALGRPVSFGFGIGKARANRKPVLALFGADGERLGFAKIGVDPFTDDQVLREREALARVQETDIPGVRTPDLLDFGTWNGHPVLVISALQPSAWQTARRGVRRPHAQMESLGRAFGVRETPLKDSPWWVSLGDTVRALPPGEAGSHLVEAVETIDAAYGDRPLAFGAWHGDWTPWNMGWSRGQVLLWDFERFEVGAPVGLDACHFAVGVPSPSRDADEIVRRLGTSSPSDDPEVAAVVRTVYLAAMNARYQVAAHSENGHLIAPLAAIMARCLSSWLSRTTDGGARG